MKKRSGIYKYIHETFIDIAIIRIKKVYQLCREFYGMHALFARNLILNFNFRKIWNIDTNDSDLWNIW